MKLKASSSFVLLPIFLLGLCCLAAAGDIICQNEGHHVVCNGTEYVMESKDGPGTSQFYVDVFLVIFCVLAAGCMSGLTIGLIGMDPLMLEVLKASGTPKERKYATSILPMVSRRHLLLVTLLLCNAAAMEALPIFLDRMMPAFAAVLVSVTAVLFFGEIIPQALCARFGLAIGHYMSWPVKFLMVLCFPISFPISKLLDFILGDDHTSFYGRGELKELVYLHSHLQTDDQEKLTPDEVKIIRAAIDMRGKTVGDAMIRLAAVYSVDADRTLDDALLQEIADSGHSRIPVYEGPKDRLIGALLVKRLFISQKILAGQPRPTCREMMQNVLQEATTTTSLYALMDEFQKGNGHMAVVKEAEGGQTVGIITLEDIIEELLAEEIVDETDRYVDVEKAIHVVRGPHRVTALGRVLAGAHRPISGIANPGSVGARHSMGARNSVNLATVHVENEGSGKGLTEELRHANSEPHGGKR